MLQQTVAGSDFDCKEGEDVGTGEHWWVAKELNGAFTPPFVWILPQKGEKLIQSESSKGYSLNGSFVEFVSWISKLFRSVSAHWYSDRNGFLQNIQTMLFAALALQPKYSSICAKNVFEYLHTGASRLSAQQEHQRQQVDHLALASGDTFSNIKLRLFVIYPYILISLKDDDIT